MLTECQYSKVQDNCMLVVPVDVHNTQRYTGFGQAMADGVFGCGFFPDEGREISLWAFTACHVNTIVPVSSDLYPRLW